MGEWDVDEWAVDEWAVVFIKTVTNQPTLCLFVYAYVALEMDIAILTNITNEGLPYNMRVTLFY